MRWTADSLQRPDIALRRMLATATRQRASRHARSDHCPCTSGTSYLERASKPKPKIIGQPTTQAMDIAITAQRGYRIKSPGWPVRHPGLLRTAVRSRHSMIASQRTSTAIMSRRALSTGPVPPGLRANDRPSSPMPLRRPYRSCACGAEYPVHCHVLPPGSF
jgi:hypothetical protein